ncbi:unnamed protein product [Alternaria alternata]
MPMSIISKALPIRMRAQSVGRFDRFMKEVWDSFRALSRRCTDRRLKEDEDGDEDEDEDEDEKNLRRRSSFVQG